VLSTNTVAPYVDINNNIYAVKEEGQAELQIIDFEDNGQTVTLNVVYFENELPENTTIEQATLELAKSSFTDNFTTVTTGINVSYGKQWNGFMVLILLSGVVSFLSSFLGNVGMKSKDKKGNTVGAVKPNPLTGVVLAVVMVMFTVNYTSAFALYIVANSVYSIIFNILINLIMNGLETHKQKKGNVVVADYVRK